MVALQIARVSVLFPHVFLPQRVEVGSSEYPSAVFVWSYPCSDFLCAVNRVDVSGDQWPRAERHGRLCVTNSG